MIDNLLKEIRAGTTLRRTGQNSVHKRRRQTSQLKKNDLERLNQIVEKATASPRKSLTPVDGYESQFKFPVVDEENKNQNEINGVGTLDGSAKVSDGAEVAAPDKGQGMSNDIGKKVSSSATIPNGQGINGETDYDIAPLPNGENHPILKSEAKIDDEGRDLSVSQPQHLSSPAVGDTATNSQSLPVTPAKNQLLDEGVPVLETVTRGPHRETNSLEKEGTEAMEKNGARSLEEKHAQSEQKEGRGALEKKAARSMDKNQTQSAEKEGTVAMEKNGAKFLEEKHTHSVEKEGRGALEKKGARPMEKKGARSKEKEGKGVLEKKGARSLEKMGAQSKEKERKGSLWKRGIRSLKKKRTETKEKAATGTLEKKGQEPKRKYEMRSPEKEATVSMEKDGSRTPSEASVKMMVSCTVIQ